MREVFFSGLRKGALFPRLRAGLTFFFTTEGFGAGVCIVDFWEAAFFFGTGFDFIFGAVLWADRFGFIVAAFLGFCFVGFFAAIILFPSLLSAMLPLP
jgi:hypothetical protein